MRFFTVFPFLLFLVLCTLNVSAQWDDEEEQTMKPTTFLQAVLQSDLVQRKIDGTIDLIDLKLHHLRLLKQLFTTENLILLRRTLEWTVSATNLLIRILPDNPEKPTLASLFHQVFGGPVDEDQDEYDNLPVEAHQDDLDTSSTDIYNIFSGVYPGNPDPAIYQNTIEGSSQPDPPKPLDRIFTKAPVEETTTKGPAPVFENQLRFGGKPAMEEDVKAVASSEATTTDANEGFTSNPVTEGADKIVQVTLSPEELGVLTAYGMSSDDAMRLATLLHQARQDRAGKAALQGEMNKAAEMYGHYSPQAMSLSRMVRGSYH